MINSTYPYTAYLVAYLKHDPNDPTCIAKVVHVGIYSEATPTCLDRVVQVTIEECDGKTFKLAIDGLLSMLDHPMYSWIKQYLTT